MMEEQVVKHEYNCLIALLYKTWWIGGFLRYLFLLPDADAL